MGCRKFTARGVTVFYSIAALLYLLKATGMTFTYAQRLDGPEIVADCQYGAGVLRLCRVDCAAQDIVDRGKRMNNDDRLRRLSQCQNECWGIMKAIENCPQRR